ncbi:hypothetical protein BGW39_001444 [Mortierella sp. 14UC]|nr:hypothetical protein BGW39_001444 [Mortierella sp. 14UC]
MDPVEYYALLKLVNAPGIVPGSGPSCQYVQTPLQTNGSTPTWGCPAGNFCLSPKHSAPCPPGFFCPANTAQPMYCCPGYYCSEDTKTISLCPQNEYCPAGSVGRGTSCFWLASCPSGSSSASKFGLILFALLLVIGICIAFWIHKRIETVRAHHLEKRLRWIHTHHAKHDNLLLPEDEDDSKIEQIRNDSQPDIHITDPNNRSTSELTSKEAVVQMSTGEELDEDWTSVGGSVRNMKIGNSGRVELTFDIEFERLGLTLSNGVSILQNVSGVLRSGRTCAIMGPSGSGKTTLISMLTSKVPKDEGKIRVNGLEEDLSYYRKLVGFVPQEDVMMRELTVHDVLLHSAYMRLPSDLTRSQKTEKVLEIVDFLGLNSVMDSVVGDAEQRGISGGQRKRVNIGMELVTEPSILFLDEPTSGLDSSTSGDVCKLLRSVARRKGLTVAAVIHSPSPIAFNQFDDLLLLGQNGRVVFHGPRTEAPAYFAAIGFPVPFDSSPSDFYMDVISNNVKSNITKKFKPFYLSRYWESYCKRAQTYYADARNGVEYRHPSTHSSNSNSAVTSPHLNPRVSALVSYSSLNHSAISIQQAGHGLPETLAMTSLSSNNNSSHALHSSSSASTLHPPVPVHQKRHSHHKSVTLSPQDSLHQRSNPSSPRPSISLTDFTSMYSEPPPPENLTFWETVQKSIRIFVIESRMWWKGVFAETLETIQGLFLRRNDPPNCVRPTDHLTEVGVFIALGVCFAGISVGTTTFGNEKIVYWREKSSGLLTLPYYLAKVIADIPRIVLAGIMFSISLVIFFNERANYFYLLFIIVMLYAVAFAMGYLLSALVPQNRVALVGTGFTLAWAIVFSGDAPDLADVMDSGASSGYAATRWLWVVSAPRYAIEAIYLREVQARPWEEIQKEPLSHTYELGQFWWCFQAMTFVLLGWHVLAFFAFKLMDRSKQK